MRNLLFFICLLLLSLTGAAQKKRTGKPSPAEAGAAAVNAEPGWLKDSVNPLKWRSIGPFRARRSVTSSGVVNDPHAYYMATTPAGLSQTDNAASPSSNISDRL